jgi:hypothetical protein
MRVFVVTLATAAIVSSAGAATTTSGLWGEVTRGPVTPVCVAEQPCYVPAGGATLLFVRKGRVVRRAIANAKGRYRVKLPVGTYSVRLAKKPSVGRGLDPVRARVVAKRFRRVDFSIDTGIR